MSSDDLSGQTKDIHKGGDYRGKMQNYYSHITHLEFVDKALEENDVHQPHEKQ
jgi:hypothetical protein